MSGTPRHGDPNRELMHVMGGSGYTAIPPDQHEWQQRTDIEENTELHRLWSWMIHHTCFFGHTQAAAGQIKAYAASADGTELDLHHAEKDLGMDIANCYRAWRKGLAIGLWRNGTKEEGKRRLYLCARVAPPKPSEDPDKIVCTDNFDNFPGFQRLAPYLQEQLRSLPPDRLPEAHAWYVKHVAVEREALAEVMAAGRMVLGDLEYTGWEQFGIKKRRLEETQKEKSPEELEEEAARQARIEALVPHVKLSVQTISESVLTIENGLHKGKNHSVQADSRGPTLLPLTTTNQTNRGREAKLEGAVPPPRSKASQEGTPPVSLPVGDTTPAAPAKAEIDAFLSDVAILQTKLRDKFGGEPVNPDNKGDRAWAAEICRMVGDERTAFLTPGQANCYVLNRAGERRALGHQITPAILHSWAGDFHRGAAARRKLSAEREAAAEKQRQVDEQRRAAREREDQLTVWTEDAWERMPAEERARELAHAEAAIKADPAWAKRYRELPSTTRKEMVETRAKATLKAKLAAVQAAKGATP